MAGDHRREDLGADEAAKQLEDKVDDALVPGDDATKNETECDSAVDLAARMVPNGEDENEDCHACIGTWMSLFFRSKMKRRGGVREY